ESLRSPPADAHFRIATVQGILAHVHRQAGHAHAHLRRAARLRTRHERGLLGPRHHPDGTDYRAPHRSLPRRFSEVLYFFAPGHEGYNLSACAEALALDRADRIRQAPT